MFYLSMNYICGIDDTDFWMHLILSVVIGSILT